MIRSAVVFLLCVGASLSIPVVSNALDGTVKHIYPAVLQDSMNHLLFRNDSIEKMRDYIKKFPVWNYRAYEINGRIYYIDYPCPDRIKNHLLSQKPWEPKETDLMSRCVHEGDVVLDIGAHIGIHTMHLCSLVGLTGHVIAIEPQMKLYRELFYNLTVNHFNNASLILSAVGSSLGSVELGIKDGNDEGTRQCKKGSNEFVDLCTIDSLNLERLEFLKIEVNGMELQVLAGAEKTLERCHPKILIELWDLPAATEWFKVHQYELEHCDGLNYFAFPIGEVSPQKGRNEVESFALPIENFPEIKEQKSYGFALPTDQLLNSYDENVSESESPGV